MAAASDYDEYEMTAEFYDSVALYANRPDVRFFVDEAKAAAGPVLELGCGTGRVLIPSARAGAEITGLELSPHMLEVCRNRLAREPAEVRVRAHLVHGDMRCFTFPLPFDLITVPFRPFLHLTTVEDQLACLRCVRKHLTPGGRFILDIFNPSLEMLVADNIGLENDEGPPFTTPDGRSVIRRYRTVSRDRAAQINQIELIYYVTHPDGRQERLVHSFAFRYLFRFEAEHLLARAGFRVEQFYGDYDRSPFGAKYPGELIFIARGR